MTDTMGLEWLPVVVCLLGPFLIGMTAGIIVDQVIHPPQDLLDVGAQICAKYDATPVATTYADYIYCVRDHVIVKKYNCELVDTGHGRSWACEELARG